MAAFIQTLRQLVSPGGIEGYFALKYAEFAENTESMRDEYRRLATIIASRVQEGKALEIGPGPGRISIELAKLAPNLQITGLDVSETMVEIAERNAAEHGLGERVEFRLGDASEMPFEDATFDFVLSSGSLHHWEQPTKVFREILRMLKPGSQSVISDVRKDAPKDQVQELADEIDSAVMRWGMRHSIGEAYTVESIQEIIDGIPFADTKVETEQINMMIWLTK